jgi:diguanylate cyclase (GGDEF)-like protein
LVKVRSQPQSNQMSTQQITLPEEGAEQRTQEIRRGLQILAQHDWSLWWTAVVVILSLTAAVASFSIWITSEPKDPFYEFHISQSVRGLLGLVLLFSVYTLYQQLQLKRVRGQLAVQIDVAGEEQKRAEEFLKLAILDPLTGLHNRRFAEERLALEMARAQRFGNSLKVMMLDLDDLKSINDLHGHEAGDMALKTFAERLMAATRGADLATRIGGDEFMVLLPECKVGGVRHILDRLLPLEIEVDADKICFSYSAGWTDYQIGEAPAELLRRADHALYFQKKSRKNQLHPVA